MKCLNIICAGLLLSFSSVSAQSDFCLSARDGFQAGITRYVYEDSHLTVWICSSTGLYRWDGAMLRYADPNRYGDTGPLLSRGVNRIHQDSRGNYWLSTAEDGILMYDVQADSLRRIPAPTSPRGNMTRCWDIIEDADGLWIGGNGGLLHVSLERSTQTFHAYVLESHGTSGPIVRAIMQDPGEEDLLWVAGTFGLAQFSKISGTYTPIHQPVDNPSWHPGDRVLMIANLYQHDSVIYGASWGGGLLAYHIAEKSWQQFLFEQDSTAEAPLDDNICQFIVPVNDSLLALTAWRHCPVLFSANTGEFAADVNNPFLGSCRNGGFSEGASVDHAGRIWLGYFNAICVQNDIVNSGATALTPRLIGIYENGTRPGIFDMNHNDGVHQFGRYQRELTFAVASGSIYPPSGLEYKLIGYDQRWQPLDRPLIRYTQLPGGNLTFSLRQSPEEGTPDLIASYPLRIQPLIHEYVWFWPAVIIPLVVLSYYLFWMRMKHRRERELLQMQYQKQVLESELTALRAQMNPHFVFNGLNSIRNYIFKQDTEAASDYLTMFSKLIRAILQNSQNKLIALRDDLDALSLYLQIESRRFKDEFEYVIDIDPSIDAKAVFIPPLLIQPYVENAIWHGLRLKSGHRLVRVQAAQTSDELKIVIEDNGIGRDAAAKHNDHSATKHQSLGMQHTAGRIDLIRKMLGLDASVQIEDATFVNGDTGTRVILTLPLITEQSALEVTK